MKHDYGEYRTINIHFDELQERQRALEMLETAGIQSVINLIMADCADL